MKCINFDLKKLWNKEDKTDSKLKIEFKKLTDTAKVPTRGSDFSAGYDLYVDTQTDTYIRPHETVMFPINIAVSIPKGYFGGIYSRSGLSTKSGLRPATCTSVIDSDYRGPIFIGIHNDTDEDRMIAAGMRVAQLIIHKFEEIDFVEVEELDETERGEGGFGSTGLQ